MNNFSKNKLDLNELLKNAKENPNQVKSQSEVEDFINKNLNESQAKQVEEVLKDKDKMQKMLSSSDAQRLFKELFGGKK